MNDSDMTPRQRRRKRRLQEIQSRAMQMVMEEGIEEFSVNKLAGCLDLTPGALYRYFNSRDAILAAVEIEVLEGFDAFFGELENVEELAARSEEGWGLKKLVILSMGYVALAELQPERFRLISLFVGGPDPILDDSVAEEVVGPTLKVIRRFVMAMVDAQADGSLREGDAMQRAAIVWSGLQGLLTHKKLTRLTQVPLSPDKLFVELLRTLLVGWGAAPAAVEQAIEQKPTITFYRQAMERSL